jgi:hypothetical protein
MPSRYCLQCQQSFGDGTGKARYCSARCRKAAFVARQAAGVAPAKVVAAPVVDVYAGNLGDLESAVMAEIGPVAARTVVGMNALLVARQLDAGEERGTAMAALSRQLQTLVLEAKRGPGAAPDIVDDLSARRQARQGA